MATRNETRLIHAARAGQPAAQLALGRYYVSGSFGLKPNLTTALYWLDRAASQGEPDAWMLIGSDIPFEIAAQAVQASDKWRLCLWYERAFDAGVVEAGLVLAKLVLAEGKGGADPALRRKAQAALEAGAYAGIAEAQYLLARQLGSGDLSTRAPAPTPSSRQTVHVAVTPEWIERATLGWLTRAALNGAEAAQRALVDHAWNKQDLVVFLLWAQPLARLVAQRAQAGRQAPRTPPSLPLEDVSLLSRCARVLVRAGNAEDGEFEQFAVLAAQAGEPNAQLALGLWFGKIDAAGNRIAGVARNGNYKKAVYWLTRSGDGGCADAWYALSKIAVKTRTALQHGEHAPAQVYLERAAEAGHGMAQLEAGIAAWRGRHADASRDVRATYWLQKAALGEDEIGEKARTLLMRIAGCATPAPWAEAAQQQMTRDIAATYPLLAARIDLAARFGLSIPEALLLDMKAADQGHCLLVDIRAEYARSKRRLIQVSNGEERLALSRAVRVFEQIDCSPRGPEGNYRQRVYLLRKLFSLSGKAV